MYNYAHLSIHMHAHIETHHECTQVPICLYRVEIACSIATCSAHGTQCISVPRSMRRLLQDDSIELIPFLKPGQRRQLCTLALQ